MRILIAEDDPVSSRILEKNLKNWGYDVVIARSGEAAWEALQDEALRLAILDWMMPGMDGPEICQKIRHRKKFKYTYIILLSAKDRKEDIVAGLSSGADDYMTKPVNFLELRARLQTGKRIIELEDKLLFIQRQLKELASRDPLTGVWNRAEIARFLREELERGQRDKRPVGVIMLDIDYFKKINDVYGHEAGDKALLQVVSRVGRRIRKSDKVGRYGGDEILIVLPNCNAIQIKKIAERLRTCVARRSVKIAAGLLAITVSAGCSSSDSFIAPSADQLIRSADGALLRAKNQGRNCVVCDIDSETFGEEKHA